MTAFDATKPTLDASNSSPFTSSMPNCDEQVATSTRLPHALSCHGKAEGSLRDASERHDGEMFPAAAVLDAQLDHCTWSPSHERRRRRARGTSRPARPGLEARPSACRERAVVDLVGSPGAESRVRSLRVVPSDVVVELASECSPGQRHDGQQARALVLQRSDVPFDDGQAPVFADSAESLLDAVTTAPGVELLCRELRAVVGDQVCWPAPDSSTRSPEEVRNLPGGWLFLEVRGPDGSPGEVIDGDGDPPAERPAQWQRERQPRDPEATTRGDHREVDVKDVVGSLRSHGSRLRRSAQSGFGLGGGWSIRRTVVAPR